MYNERKKIQFKAQITTQTSQQTTVHGDKFGVDYSIKGFE